MAVSVQKYGGIERDRHGALNVGDVAMLFNKWDIDISETNLKIKNVVGHG